MKFKNISKIESVMTFKQFILNVWEIYKPFKKVVLTLVVLLFLREMFHLINPYIYGKIIDGIISGKAMRDVLILLSLAVGVYILNNLILGTIREFIEIKKLDFDIRRRVANVTLKKMFGFSIGQHENQNSGIKKSVIDKGEHSLTTLAFDFIYEILPIILQVTVVLSALFYIAPLLGTIVLLGVIIYTTLSLYINYIFGGDIKKLDDMYHDLSKKHNEILRNVSLVKINAKEKEILNEYDGELENINNFAKKLWFKFVIFAQTRGIFSHITRFIVMAVGIYLIYQKIYTPGFLVVFWTWSNRAFDELNHLSNIHRRVMELYVAVKNYFILINVEPDIKEIISPIISEKFNGKIEFKDVRFKYPKMEYVKEAKGKKEEGKKESGKRQGKKNVLENINFIIEPGQKVAIVGPSGSGKSTLVQLLLRSYDSNEGNIFIDGNDLKNFNLENYRSSIGMVSQDIALFDETLKYNILFGVKDEKISNERIWTALKMASIDKFILGLEKGLDTIVGERGVRLSGGERQRVGIARALIKNPSILIFDEATSSLDTENEALIHESIKKASYGRTTIIIAHRLSTVKDADKIIVIENGRIVGEGKHDELLKTCSTYQRLINNQTVVVEI